MRDDDLRFMPEAVAARGARAAQAVFVATPASAAGPAGALQAYAAGSRA
jgi:hypothetical protein